MTTAIHAEDAHDLLAAHDLRHHIPEHHGTDLTDINTQADVETWMEANGIESTGERDLDILQMWHEQAHQTT